MTDVEGSTSLWERLPDRMPQAMTRHHQIIHAEIERHGGRRPEDQGEGDSVFAAFPRPSAAVTCALASQRALASEAWPEGLEVRVRMLKGGKSLSNSPEQVVAAADRTLPDASSRFRLASRRSCRLPVMA